MVEIPEHLLARARQAREKASSRIIAASDYLGSQPSKITTASDYFGNQYHTEDIPEDSKPDMRTFKVVRSADASGVSGTGVVLEGVIFSSGKCIINWTTKTHPGSTSIFESFEHFKEIHIDSHLNNKTIIIWSDGITWRQDED